MTTITKIPASKKQEIIEQFNTDPRRLFAITSDNIEVACNKFRLWVRLLFPQAWKKNDSSVHHEMDRRLCNLYFGGKKSFLNIGFRGLAKTARTRVFIAFMLANDHRPNARRYIKVASEDYENSKSMVVAIYNTLHTEKCVQIYPNLFQEKKGANKKREETMHSFTLNDGRRLFASTINRNQRGHLSGDEEANRPDLVLFEDIETSDTVQSLTVTNSIWRNMEEAFTGLSEDGVAMYNANYISRRRNIAKLIARHKRNPDRHDMLITPIMDKRGNPTWEQEYPKTRIEAMKSDIDDFEGEMMCDPKDGNESWFSETHLSAQPLLPPLLSTGQMIGGEQIGWVYYYKRDPNCEYSIGIDPAGGLGGNFAVLSVVNLTKGRLEAFYRDRHTAPDTLALLAIKTGKRYNNALLVPEMNYDGAVFAYIFKQKGYNNYYMREVIDKQTNQRTKQIGLIMTKQMKKKLLTDLSRAINNFQFLVTSEILFNELLEFPREYSELVKPDSEEYGHFDLTIATCLAWEGRTQTIGRPQTI